MTTLERTAAPAVATSTLRRTARIAGWLYLATFVTSIPARALYGPALEQGWVLGSGSVAGVQLGLLLDILCALTAIGTAVALYPVVRRQDEGVALAFVASRTLEASALVLGVVSLFAVVTLRQTGGDATTLNATGDALVAVHSWAYLVGPGILSGVNALLLGSLLYRSGLVPRAIPLVGLIGAPFLLASGVATMFGAYDQFSPVAAVAALPVAAWELSVGLWMAFKGFRPSSVVTSA